MLEVGVKAPEFKLLDKDGNEVSLSDFKNKKLVLYFYPRDNTAGCTKQACAFRDSHEEFTSKDVVVIGISKDREINRLDLESINFHNKVREGYKIVLNKYPNRVIEIDASKDKETVFKNVMEIINEKLKEKKLID